ncbi:MAG: lipase family protein [Methylocella sp.]
MTITANTAWALCAWVDGGASGSPPPPWTAVFVPPPPTMQNPNFAVILQDSSNTVQYALVIQGTTNILDLFNDLEVNKPGAFLPVSGAQIANGASTGLNNVLGLKDGNTSLQDFLSSIDWSPNNSNCLFLAGHSLGGTLASIMAPWAAVNLFGQQQPLGSSPGSLPASIQAITFAPYAAGNQQFATFLNNQPNYQANFNENDAVPYAWATTGQYSVSNMYNLFPSPGPYPMPSWLKNQVINIVNGIPVPPKFSGYVQTSGNNSFNFKFPTVKVPPLTVDPWLWELSYQHNYAYCMTFGGSASSCQYLMPSEDSLTRERRRIGVPVK